MGHVQAFRNYPVLKSINLTDKEFKIYTDISFGNSFTTAMKSKYHTAQASVTNTDLIDESQEVESVFVFEGIEEAMNEPLANQQVQKVKEIEVPLESKVEETKDQEMGSQNSSDTIDKSGDEEMIQTKTVPKAAKPVKKPSIDSKRAKSRSKSRERPLKLELDIDSLIEKFYKENRDLVLRIKDEVLHIAGDLKLQRKLLSCEIKPQTFLVTSKQCQVKVCRFWPIFNEVKPKAIRKTIMNRSFKRLRDFNI